MSGGGKRWREGEAGRGGREGWREKASPLSRRASADDVSRIASTALQ